MLSLSYNLLDIGFQELLDVPIVNKMVYIELFVIAFVATSLCYGDGPKSFESFWLKPKGSPVWEAVISCRGADFATGWHDCQLISGPSSISIHLSKRVWKIALECVDCIVFPSTVSLRWVEKKRFSISFVMFDRKIII